MTNSTTDRTHPKAALTTVVKLSCCWQLRPAPTLSLQHLPCSIRDRQCIPRRRRYVANLHDTFPLTLPCIPAATATQVDSRNLDAERAGRPMHERVSGPEAAAMVLPQNPARCPHLLSFRVDHHQLPHISTPLLSLPSSLLTPIQTHTTKPYYHLVHPSHCPLLPFKLKRVIAIQLVQKHKNEIYPTTAVFHRPPEAVCCA